MDPELKRALEAMEANIEAMQTRILERIEQMENKLLSAFGQTPKATS
jgi:hypothetical protein